MTDLQNISSNLLLVGFVLISLCCLYLLYSNFTKIRDINDLKRNIEDLKTIFFNQQKHNDETYNNLINIIKSDDKISDKVLDINIETTKTINIDENVKTPTLIRLTKENINNIKNVENILTKNVENILTKNVENILTKNIDSKSINIDLEDLDKLDEMKEISEISDCESDLNSDENVNNLDLNDNKLLNEKVIDDNIFDIIHSIKNNEPQDLFNDNNSITTDPIIDDLDETNFDIDDLNNLMNSDDEDGNEDGNEDDENVKDNEEKTTIDDLDTLDLDNFDLDTIEVKNDSVKTVIDANIKIISVNKDTTDTTETIELDALLSGTEDIKNIKNININGNGSDNSNEKTEYNLENLNNMSIKQLKEVAKQYKAKISGTKQDLIQSISKALNL